MLIELRKTEEHSENFNKELENTEKTTTIWAEEYSNWNGKKKLETINSRLDNSEEWIGDLEDKIVEITQSEW